MKIDPFCAGGYSIIDGKLQFVPAPLPPRIEIAIAVLERCGEAVDNLDLPQEEKMRIACRTALEIADTLIDEHNKSADPLANDEPLNLGYSGGPDGEAGEGS